MKQRKDRLIIKWNFEVKTYLAFFIIMIFGSGLTIGMFAGKVTAYKACEATAEPTTEVVAEATTEPTTAIPEETPTKTFYDVPLSERLQRYIFNLCKGYDLPIPLVMAVIETESSFKADALSDTDDYGLMQVNEVNHERFTEEYGITDFFDPYKNVFCGITILAEHYAEYEDIDMALMAYNLGAYGAKELWDIGIYQTDYTEQIRANMEAYEGGLKW